MNESKIPVRYARALFLAARDNGLLNEVADDVRQLGALCSESSDFQEFLQSGIIKKSEKATIIETIFSGKVNQLTMRFLLLLAENRREVALPAIVRDFTDMLREHNGILPVLITSSSSLTEETKENINRYLSLKTGKKIELNEKVNPEILGGLILRMGDLQYDGSMVNQLRKIRESLLRKELIEIKQ